MGSEECETSRSQEAGGSGQAEGRHPSPWAAAFRKLTGLEPSGELLAISMVYLVQGFLDLSTLALRFFFKDNLQVEPSEVAILLGLADMPWVVKPLYGFISDSIPLFGYRRRSYLVLCGLTGTLAWLLLATVVNTSSMAVLTMVVASLGTAFSDVVVDSIVVERARGEPQATSGSLQSLCWGSSAVGSIASAYFSGSLVDAYGPRFVFALTSCFPLIISISAFLISDKRITGSKTHHSSLGGPPGDGGPSRLDLWRVNLRDLATRFKALLLQLWGALKQKRIILPTLFMFLWNGTPDASTAMFYFQTNELGFTPEFLGRVSLVAAIASLIGVILYNNTGLKRLPVRRIIFWCIILGFLLGSTTLILVSGLNRKIGLSDQLFVLGDSVILVALGKLSLMPIMVLAARICPEGVEATLFATLMSILNAGSFVGTAIGAAMTEGLGVTSTNFDHLFVLILLCNVLSLLPAPFICLLSPELDQESPGEHGGDKAGEVELERRGLLSAPDAEEEEEGGEQATIKEMVPLRRGELSASDRLT